MDGNSPVVGHGNHIRCWRGNHQVVNAVRIQVAHQHQPLILVVFAFQGRRWNGVHSSGVLTGQRPDQVHRKGGAALGGGGHLFDVVGIEVHAEHISEIVVLKQQTTVVLHAVNAEQHDLAGGGQRVQNVCNAVFVNLKFKLLPYGPLIEEVIGPIRTAEVHLVERTGGRPHQPPLQSLRGDVERQMGWRYVLHDGAGVPARAVVVGCTLLCVSAHLQVVTVGVKDPGKLIGGDTDGAVHQIRSVGGGHGVDETGGPGAGWPVNSCSNRALLGAPAKMGFVMPREFHVGCAVVFAEGDVQPFRLPQVKHGFLSNRGPDQTVDVKGGPRQVVAVARSQRKRATEANLGRFIQRRGIDRVHQKGREERQKKKHNEAHAFASFVLKIAGRHTVSTAGDLENHCSPVPDPRRGSIPTPGINR